MKILLKYGKVLLINILSFLIILFFLTLIYYFNGIDDKTYSLLKLITLLISIFIQSFSLGKKRKNKKYLEGLYYGLFIILLLFSFSTFTHYFQIKSIYYYFMILCISILGSMFGFSKEKR